MLITDVFCYALLTITVTASCAAADKLQSKKHELDERNSDKRMRRQEPTTIIDSFPLETVYQKPKVINYRRLSRISRQRYGPPVSKYGPPRPKYGPPKPGKKYRGKPGKYRPSTLRRTPKPKSRYGPPKRAIKPTYGPPRKPPHYSYYPPEPVGFGEPPSNYAGEFQPKPNYGEPPVDSYGAPVKSNLNDLYPAVHNYDAPVYEDFSNFGQYQSWSAHRNHNTDSSYASSKKVPMFAKPQELFVTPVPEDNEESLTSYSEIYDHRQKEHKTSKNKKRNPQTESTKVTSWKAKQKPETKAEDEDEIIVGGQYAEPPARYVANFQPSAPMYQDDDFSPGIKYDSDGSASATVSAYVNYKNSNMAFSPQNLNDAFSIVDK
ncbi:extensin [Manduca sexta]|uniref:Adhesive plaque matrix protein-like n=1 Tax=Manduca sexta TaxID=7130 RepID=A0A921YQH0_MANSE|nr:extensin [Manduca sexta]KAG6443528.1 hypothetical protein O3G_MSEX002934 [Manduca sexta]